MAYTKDIARHDKITIDGTDVSNAFRQFSLQSEDSEEDASGFSASGVDEVLQGARAQGFQGEWFYTPESYAVIAPIHFNRETVEITWQPNGLTDPTREVYYGNCKILTFSPEATRGSVRTSPFNARAADENGIQVAAGT